MKTVLPLLATLAAVTAATPSFAAEPGSAYGKSVGTITWVNPNVATNPDAVRRQGGFATPAGVHWITTTYARPNA